MRWNEIINESRSAELYHGTTAEAAEQIAHSGFLQSGRLYKINGRETPGISATRDKHLNYSCEDGPGSASVIFVLNQRNIAARYRIVPYMDNGFSRADTTESEEVICTKQLPLNAKTVDSVVFRQPAPTLLKWCEATGIPTHIEYFEHDENDHWDPDLW